MGLVPGKMREIAVEALITRDLRSPVGMAHGRQPPRTARTMSSAFRAPNEMITTAPT
jgi:hypothetical protein